MKIIIVIWIFYIFALSRTLITDTFTSQRSGIIPPPKRSNTNEVTGDPVAFTYETEVQQVPTPENPTP